MRRNHIMLAMTGVVGCAATSAFAQFSIPWYTVDGGGGFSSGGGFTIKGTIGQHDAGSLVGASFTINGGFWSRGVDSGCAADLDDGSGTGTPDGGVTIDDLIYFLTVFEAGLPAADLDDDGINPPNPDGGVTIDDLLFFLLRFEAGC